LSGLDAGIIPIFPTTKKFRMVDAAGKEHTVSRLQLPMTPAYAFTDYRSQGQTIPNVIVDISTPPTGHITAFNAYVALSRSKGRQSIRLLRDFSNELFTKHANEYLRVEDDRLYSLD
ncbi:hypothetical protein CALCODRAFT_423258, partial [Calocera cornea HHB12733]